MKPAGWSPAFYHSLNVYEKGVNQTNYGNIFQANTNLTLIESLDQMFKAIVSSYMTEEEAKECVLQDIIMDSK